MSFIKHEIRHFDVVVVQKRKRNVQKVSCTCKVVVLLIKPIAFMKFPLPSSDLKVPIKLLARESSLYLYYELRSSFSFFPPFHTFFHIRDYIAWVLEEKMLIMGCSN